MNRRDLMRAAPAVLVAGAAPAVDSTVTPVERLFREWESQAAIVDAACNDKAMPDEEFDELVGRQTDLENMIWNTPSRDTRDLAMKFYARSCVGTQDVPSAFAEPQFWDEARALIGGAA